MKQLLVLVLVAASVVGDALPPSCSRPVYCDSELLHQVQLAQIYTDSKTFVDLPMRQDQNTTLAAFDALRNSTGNNATKDELKAFVQKYFNEEEDELYNWTPDDYSEKPMFLEKICDDLLREFGKNLNDIWPTLGKKVKPEVFDKPEQFSLVPVSNGFIIPGGRFKEIYYWDAYWIIEGLLISGMDATAKGMIENLLELLEKFGHIPNGSRWYYEQRSQPPLLSAMMMLYYEKTKDAAFLAKHIESLEKEMDYWMKTQAVDVKIKGKRFTLLQYNAPSAGPRPESYYEDYTDAQKLNNSNDQTEFYIDIKSAAESGWDFSSRWFVSPAADNSGDLTNIHTRYIVPVDLNAIFADALRTTAAFHIILNNRKKAVFWSRKAHQWINAIEEVLWNEKDGIWYDYDMKNMKHRQYFYPSNMAPLWRQVVSDFFLKSRAPQVINYLKKSGGISFPGGIPASLVQSGQQWDFPNVWPPEVSIVVKGLEALNSTESKELAFTLAQEWVRICRKGYNESKIMYEKYDAENPGAFGGGGEYTVQAGFGWTNGVVLEFLDRYGDRMTAYESCESEPESEYLTDRDSNAPAENKATRLEELGVVTLIMGANHMSSRP